MSRYGEGRLVSVQADKTKERHPNPYNYHITTIRIWQWKRSAEGASSTLHVLLLDLLGLTGINQPSTPRTWFSLVQVVS